MITKKEMSILNRLSEDLKQAMRDKDVVHRTVIRLLRSELHNEEIARQAELTEEQVVAVLSRQAQQRRDSMEAFAKGDRKDLVDKEKAELAIVLEYLPEQMHREDITKLAQEVIEEVGAGGPQDMGKVMGKIMPQVRGRAEGREVSAIITDLLKTM